MKRITLISDTHGYCEEDVLEHLQDCDEVWHAGDIGPMSTTETFLEQNEKLVAVYGNIDDNKTRQRFALNQIFICEGVKIFITHIGGYPGKYTNRVKKILKKEKPDLYICGHSHILKIMRDPKYDLLHMNPGACGHAGFHYMRTLIKFKCEEGKLTDVEVVELGRRGRLKT